MTWQQFVTAGRLKPHQTSKKELDALRSVVKRDLDDAAIKELSDDRRFATAYNAALQTCTMVIACSGYKTAGAGHHQTTFEAIETAMGKAVASYSASFEVCRRKRNKVDYDMSGIATTTEVDQLIKDAHAFRTLAEAWILKHHPTLA